MKRASPRTFVFLLLGLGAVVVSIFVAPGCTTWHTRKYGDAKLKRENYHFRNIRIGMVPASRDFVSFPEIALDTPATNVFHVRNFPTNRVLHEFTLQLPKKYPVPVNRKNAPLPWHRARLQIIARDLEGRELFARPIALDNLPWWNRETREYATKTRRRNWNEGWQIVGLEEALRAKPGYDLIVIVEESSAEKGNTIQIRGESANWNW